MQLARSKKALRGSLFALGTVLLASSALAPAYAAQAPAAPIVAVSSFTSEQANKVDVTVYGRYAQVEESRTVTLAAGHNRIQLSGIASKYRNDSLRIISANGPGSFTYVSSTYQPATLTKEKLLQASIGKEIAVSNSTNGNSFVRGKLIGYNGNQLIVQDSAGGTAIINDSGAIAMETPAGLSNTSSLVVEADVAQAGEYTLAFLYETEGLSWQAKHSAIYDEAKNSMSLESTVSLVNQSGTTFKNATVWLVTGQSSAREATEGRSYALAAAPAGADFKSASAENLGEQKVYKLPGQIDLSDGQSRLVPLFSSKDVTVKREYFVAASYYSYPTEKQSVNVRLNITNSEKDHLGLPIPAGLVKIYQTNSEGRLQVVGTAQVGHVSKDEQFALNIGTASDIKVEGKMTAVKTAAPRLAQGEAEYQDQTFTMTVSNFKSEPVSVKMELGVPAQQDDVTPLVRDSADHAHVSIDAPAGSSGTVQYTLHVQTR